VAADLAAGLSPIDFAARVTWWRERWRNELVPNARSSSPNRRRTLIGFVTIDAKAISTSWWWPRSLGLDPRNALVDEASACRPTASRCWSTTDNARAIRFYERNGFAHAGEDVNPTSGRPVLRMEWKG
jgi:putative acetyltransferase